MGRGSQIECDSSQPKLTSFPDLVELNFFELGLFAIGPFGSAFFLRFVRGLHRRTTRGRRLILVPSGFFFRGGDHLGFGGDLRFGVAFGVCP